MPCNLHVVKCVGSIPQLKVFFIELGVQLGSKALTRHAKGPGFKLQYQKEKRKEFVPCIIEVQALYSYQYPGFLHHLQEKGRRPKANALAD